MSALLKDAITTHFQEKNIGVSPDELIVKATQKGLKADAQFNYTAAQSLIIPTAHELSRLARTIDKGGAAQAGLVVYGLALLAEEDNQRGAETGEQAESVNAAALQAALDQLIQDHDFQAVAGEEIASLSFLLNPKK